jgi:predicted transcriptional regulator
MLPAKAVLDVTEGRSIDDQLARAQSAMVALQRGKMPKAHFGVGLAQAGEMLAVFTPKRWELIARLREIGPPPTTAELARRLDRDYKNVHPEAAAPSQWHAVQRTEDGGVHVPWSEIVVDLKLPERMAA